MRASIVKDGGRGRRARRGDLLRLGGDRCAINKLIGVLGPNAIPQRARPTATGLQRTAFPADERPVVFIGPYEHHSNELPWRESIADVVTIDEGPDGKHRSQPSSSAELVRYGRPPAQDRQLLGRLQRDGDRHQHAGGGGAAAQTRGALLLGLRGRRTLREDRDEHGGRRAGWAPRLQGRDLPVAAQVHRRARHPR